jgi:MATE family multidrug resistance protein
VSLRSEIAATGKLAIPMALSQLATMAMGVTDVIMSGWLGPEYLAAEALGTSFFVPLYFLGMGLAMAISPMVAFAVAKGDQLGSRRSLRQGLWVIIFITIPAMIILSQGDRILRLIGQDPSLTVMTQGYLNYALWGTLSAYAFLVFRNYLAAYSKPNIALIATAIAIPVNAAGNYVFMFGKFGFPRMELEGLGLSTTLTSYLATGILFAYLIYAPKFRAQELFKRFYVPDWGRFREVLGVGLPISGTLVAETFFLSMLTFLIGLLGVMPLAAHGIAWQWVAISYMMFTGIAQASTVRVGLATGAGDLIAMRHAGISGGLMGLILSVVWAAAFVFFGAEMAGIFLDPAHPNTAQTIALATSFLIVGAYFQLGDAAQVIALGLLRGLKDTKIPMIVAIAGYWVLGLAAAILWGFVLDGGGLGIWMGAAVGFTVIGIVCFWRFFVLTKSPEQEDAKVPSKNTR